MFEEPKEKNPHEYENIQIEKSKKTNKSGVSQFVGKVHSVNGLHLCAAFLQIFLGTSVVALSLIELIQPNWLATVMTIIGSLTTIIGLYFMYSIFSVNGAFDSLLNKAIKRVITFQN